VADQIPDSTKSEHVSWTVNATSYPRNLDSEDLDAETIAVHYQKAPEKTETGTRISLCFPTLIVSGYCSEPREVADRVARILNAHWDEPAAPPAMDREAVAKAIGDADGAFGYSCNLTRLVDGAATYTLTMPGYEPADFDSIDDAHLVITERRNAARADAILSTLSADAIRQGEGGWKAELREFASLMVDEVIARTKVQLEAGNGLSVADQLLMLEQLIIERKRQARATPASHASDGGEA